ncbi:MAG: DNA recombination protein RmuC [Janthinobacterium lividum]
MLAAVVVLQVVLVILVLLLRRPVASAATDPRMATMPDTLAALGGKLDAMDAALRNNVSELRYEQGKVAQEARNAANAASTALREEITTSIERLSKTLHEGLGGFRTDNAGSAERLREAVHRELIAIGDRLTDFAKQAGQSALGAQDSLHRSLAELGQKNAASHDTLRESIRERLHGLGLDQRAEQERMRTTVEAGLKTMNTDNAAKLEQMRVTVDEKLQATLNDRLTQSFGQVTTHLGEVQKGLGEMKELANGVSDLKKVFSNVKSRGIVGEFQLGMQLEQMFSREQYEVNWAVKANSQERVEYALKIPDGEKGHVLLPIDAKFPREDWERLEHANDHGTEEDKLKAGVAFERAIRTEGKRICEKYIDPPATLPFAIMFLPTEALYAEVMRRPGLHTDLQASCNVTVAGPSSFMAILTSFQMGFRTLAIQKKGNEVWNVLGSIKKEFGKFEVLMNKVETNVRTVQNTLSDIGVRTRAINKNLHNVSELHAPDTAAPADLLAFENVAGIAPLLAAAGEDQASA